MKRSLFFWLEKLKITRAERLAVTLLLLVLMVLVSLNAIVQPATPFQGDYYHALEQQFHKRSALLKQEERQLMQQYGMAITADTLPSGEASTTSQPLIKGNRININTADAATLEQLPGIGPTYASRIVAYRRQNGPFTTIQQLLKIKGIGSARLAKLKPLIQLGDSAALADSLQSNSNTSTTSTPPVSPKEPAFIINVNTAGAEMLNKLPGIGPVYAGRIIDYRRQNGPFTSKHQLLKIKGIGKKRLAKLEPFIKLTEKNSNQK